MTSSLTDVGVAAGSDTGRRQLERLTFFSDAVFAIAMTLLVVEVRLPHLPVATDAALGQALLGLIPNYVGFLVSFLVLGRSWTRHHRIMGQLRCDSPQLVRANLVLLMIVAFMPFPTAVISEYAQLRVGVGFYTGWLTLLGLANRTLIRIAFTDDTLLAPGVGEAERRESLRASWIPLVIGGAAFAAGMIAPLAAVVVLVVVSPIVAYVLGRRNVRPG